MDPAPKTAATAEEEKAERARRRAAGLCPTCGDVKLSRYERAHGYQCSSCTARDEGREW